MDVGCGVRLSLVGAVPLGELWVQVPALKYEKRNMYFETLKRKKYCESSPEGGFTAVGNWRTRRVFLLETPLCIDGVPYTLHPIPCSSRQLKR